MGIRIRRCLLRERSCSYYPMRYIWNRRFPFAEDNLRCPSHCDKLEQHVKIEVWQTEGLVRCFRTRLHLLRRVPLGQSGGKHEGAERSPGFVGLE